MAINVKDIESKTTTAKRNITIKDVSIVKNTLVDEQGNIIGRLIDAIGDYADSFTIKITIDMPEDEDKE